MVVIVSPMKHFWLIFFFTPCAVAAPTALRPFLDQYCIDCHDADVKKGGLDLATLPFDGADLATHKKWVRVFDRVTAGEMPPPKKDRPEANSMQGFLASLGDELTAQHQAEKGTVLRRLNRHEYQNTMSDLLGVKVDVIDLLPEDGRAHGFDNIGEALSISGQQMMRYMEAAELALNAALNNETRPENRIQKFTLESDRNKENIGKHWLKRADGAIVVFNDGGFPSTQIPDLRAPSAGRYKVRVTGYGYQIEEPVVFSLITSSFDFRSADAVVHSFHELPVGKPGTVEIEVDLKERHGIKLSPQGLNGPDGHSAVKDGPAKYPGEGLALLSVELEGPIIDQWPPRGQSLLLGDLKLHEIPPDQPWKAKQRGYKPKFTVEGATPSADARKGLSALVRAAFRRPVKPDDVQPFVNLFEAEFAQSQDYLTALRTAAVAVLCSPDFLYLQEPQGMLSDHQIASRLSYFLTRSAPDAELLEAPLAQPVALHAQVERLLNSRSMDRFIADFTDGWLNLREIDFTTPDKVLYPEYDPLLLDSMLRETRGFIAELFTQNLSVRNLIDSDFAMLNGRLARHYNIDGVSGIDVRKVSLPAESQRGGLLTQGSVLKVSANGTNTSPVIRGVWVMDRLLGQPPQPPPPGIPGVEPDIRGAKTMREILEKHRQMESCNGCHRSIDPPGFALESYDVIGGYRERFRSLGEGEQVRLKVEGRNVRYRLGPPVDAAGELPTGERFQNFTEFQKLLLSAEDRIAQALAEKLLTFATGRGMGFSDRPEIARIVAASKAKGHGLRELLHLVVESRIFSSK